MCLDDQLLNTYLDGELAEPWKSQVEEHLSYCTSCRARFQNLFELSNAVKASVLTDEELEQNQNRVLSMIEKNHLSKKKRSSFLRRQFKVSAPQLVGVAAAFVVVFVGSWAVFGNNGRKDNAILMPEVNTSIDINNITQTRSSDNTQTLKSLENYTLEDIIKNLDARGYDVDIRLKSIQPLSLSSSAAEVRVIATVTSNESVISIFSDGIARDQNGTIFATGVKLSENGQVVSSDGKVLFEASQVKVIAYEEDGNASSTITSEN